MIEREGKLYASSEQASALRREVFNAEEVASRMPRWYFIALDDRRPVANWKQRFCAASVVERNNIHLAT
jgi:hypothetical protein